MLRELLIDGPDAISRSFASGACSLAIDLSKTDRDVLVPPDRSAIAVFGGFRLLPHARRLEHEGREVKLVGRPFDLLVTLVELAGETVSIDTLMERVWGGINVEPSNLRFQIKTLRRVLSEADEQTSYIANVSGRGYSFTANVDWIAEPKPAALGREVSRKAVLPQRNKSIVGRDDDIAALDEAIRTNAVTTLVGAGGIGKTTLAVEVASRIASRGELAVTFFDLAPLRDGERVSEALASLLGVGPGAGDELSGVIRSLSATSRLLIFDNCEHVIDPAAELIGEIAAVQGTRILATSREALNIDGEKVHRLSPLAYPATPQVSADEAVSFSAVELFLDRASSSGSFRLDDESAPAVVEICRRLDGIPLAIELAAARVEFFGAVKLAAALEDVLGILTQGRRFAVPRHQTLRAMIDWGYQLLSATEQQVLRAVSIFPTYFDMDAAVAVSAVGSLSQATIIESLQSLSAKSMLSIDASRPATPYRLLETTRTYARERLIEHGDADELARRHADEVLRRVEDAEAEWDTTPREAWLRRDEGKIDDIRAALDWSLSDGGDPTLGVALCAASAPLWFALHLIKEFAERARDVARRAGGTELSSRKADMKLALSLSAAIFNATGPGREMEAVSTRALDMAKESHDSGFQLRALWQLAGSNYVQGDYQKALELSEAFEALAVDQEDQSIAMVAQRMMALGLHSVGRHDEAEAYARRSVEAPQIIAKSAHVMFNEIDSEVASRSHLSRILWLRGQFSEASSISLEGVEKAVSIGYPPVTCYILSYSACPIAVWSGDNQKLAYQLDLFDRQLRGYDSRHWQSWLEAYRVFGTTDPVERGEALEQLRQKMLAPNAPPLMADLLATMDWRLAGDVALTRARTGAAGWSAPEIRRASGEKAKRDGADPATVEGVLMDSFKLAQRQGARAWQLRSAISLASLPGASAEARTQIRTAFELVDQSYDFGDLAEARRLAGD